MKANALHVIGLALGAAALAQSGCDKAAPRAEPPPPKVSVAKPEVRQVVDYEPFNGWLQSAETVDVRSRVRGHLDKIHFTDGDLVEKGKLLFELDPRPIQADVERSKDQVKIYQAQLVAAQKEEARLKDLVKKGGASQSQVDAAEAQTLSLEAQVEAEKQEVTRKSLDLEYSRITAPIAGKIGRAMLTTGNLVNAGGSDPILATIVSIDPIYVYFDVDERTLQRYRKNHESGTRPGSVREAKLPFDFGQETDVGYPHKATLDFADIRVDPQTGTIQLRGVVANADAKFIPGSRVRIRVPISDAKPALLVPDTAILADQDKRYVLALDDKNVVQRLDVEPGKLLDDGSRVIRQGAAGGLSAEDRIITQGTQVARLNYPVEPVGPAAKAGAGAGPSAPTSAPSAAAQ